MTALLNALSHLLPVKVLLLLHVSPQLLHLLILPLKFYLILKYSHHTKALPAHNVPT